MISQPSRPSQPWPYNPLVTLIRRHSTHIIDDVIAQYESEHGFKVSAFDLVIQTMIIACSYPPVLVWQSVDDTTRIAEELVSKGAPDMALGVLEAAIETGAVSLNEQLIKTIALEQLEKLYQLHTERVELPVRDGQVLPAFESGAELHMFQLTDTAAGDKLYEAVAVDKASKKKVTFKPVDMEVSRAYIKSFHYLHTVRDDDMLAFGAFTDDDVLFALVTYAPIGRTYKKKMLKAAGVDPQLAFELTRGWNCEGSPKNTMSLLYAYAHSNIQQLYLQDKKQVLTVMTAVNPNLGFKGSAFRAVGFSLIGHKPTKFHYVVDSSGKRSFATRRSLSRMLKSKKSKEVSYIASHFPLLPTKELAVHLRGSGRVRHTGTIYSIDSDEYIREAPSLQALL